MARRGWRVRIYEQAGRPGGLLMYGIPNMKLPKWIIERRVNLMRESGMILTAALMRVPAQMRSLLNLMRW